MEGKIIMRKVCNWNKASDYNYSDIWETECGEIFTFIDGSIDDNDFKFCPYCGNPIKPKE